MSNIHRLRVTDKIFFVTCSLLPNQSQLEPGDFEMLVEVLRKYRECLGFLLCGYVLMPDHWHALIWPPAPLSISKAMQAIKSESSGKLNKRRNTRGANWQHQFRDRFVRHKRELSQRLDYMHYNPVRRT